MCYPQLIHCDVRHTLALTDTTVQQWTAAATDTCPNCLLTFVSVIRILSSSSSSLCASGWYGVIFIRKGHYRGGIFKFLIKIPHSYPDEAPKVFFTSEVSHTHNAHSAHTWNKEKGEHTSNNRHIMILIFIVSLFLLLFFFFFFSLLSLLFFHFF